jgi:hypothetical protein
MVVVVFVDDGVSLPGPASIAPGMTRTIRLSTISMTVIESVSEAKASEADGWCEGDNFADLRASLAQW